MIKYDLQTEFTQFLTYMISLGKIIIFVSNLPLTDIFYIGSTNIFKNSLV